MRTDKLGVGDEVGVRLRTFDPNRFALGTVAKKTPGGQVHVDVGGVRYRFTARGLEFSSGWPNFLVSAEEARAEQAKANLNARRAAVVEELLGPVLLAAKVYHPAVCGEFSAAVNCLTSHLAEAGPVGREEFAEALAAAGRGIRREWPE